MFRQAHDRFEENNAQVLGISCDTVHAHKAWGTAMGGLPYPELSDFHPKGQTTQAYDLWNDERGAGNRAIVIVDKGGIVRFRETYQPGILPDPNDIIAEVQKLDG